jgi:hypothetical protein
LKFLIACECSGAVRRALRELGHDAWSNDLQPAEDGSPFHIQADAIEVAYSGGWDAMIAHPECTRLTNAGARWLQKPPPRKTQVQMWRALFAGAEFYKALRDAPIALKAIENPVMHCHARELIQPGSRQIVQPWWFGDPFFKATGFELIGLPRLVATNKLTPPRKGTPEHKAWSAVHMASPGPNRSRERSRTFPGIAAAMAMQWGGTVADELRHAA